MFGVGSMGEAFRLVISLYDEIIGSLDMELHVFCDISSICDETEHNIAIAYLISYIVNTVVWDMETCHIKTTDGERLRILYLALIAGAYLLSHATVVLNALQHSAGGIDRQAEV